MDPSFITSTVFDARRSPTRALFHSAVLLWICALGLLAIHPRLAFGQAEQGTITGRVTDKTGAVVSGAKVTATEVSTQTLSSTVTNNDGYYTLPYLAPGTYNVSTESQSFSTSTVAGIHLTVGLSTNVNFVMLAGNVSQQVTVQANAIQLETDSSELGSTFYRDQILDLPQVGGRNAYALDFLSPGVIPEVSGSPLEAEINGGMANTSNMLLDGGIQVNSSTGDPSITAPSESIGEMKTITNNFDAEYGMSGGGVLTATTKGGTNSFHGSAYEYLLNDVLNANGWYRNYTAQPRAPVHQNLFGFSVGGPVRIPKLYNGKNKTFFFVNFEENPSKSADAIVGTVPTAAMRNGDFSGLVDQNGKQIVIYDPNTTTLVSGTTYTRSQISYHGMLNVIDPTRINDIAQKVLAYYPLPNAPGIQGIYNNYLATPARTTHLDNLFVRVDQNFGTSHKAFIRIGRAYMDANTPTPTIAFPSGTNNGDPGSSLNYVWTGAVSDTWTIKPNLLAEIRGNFIHRHLFYALASNGFNASTLGLPSSFVQRVESNVFPYFNITDESTLGVPNSGVRNTTEGSYEGQAHITWVKGPHSVKAGFDYLFVYYNGYRPTSPAGTFAFSRTYTQGPNPAQASTDAGWGFATFLLGLPTSGSISKDPSLTSSQKASDGYVEDDYKITQNLTVNLGLRYDLLTGFTDRHDQLAWFDPTAPDPVVGLPGSLEFAGSNGNRRQMNVTAYTDFSPRLGFAYQLGTKTVVRGGFGFFYTTNSGATTGLSGPQATTNLYLGAPSPAPNTPPPGGTLDNPYVAGYLNPPNYLVGSGITDPFSPGTVPLLQSRNFSIQRTLSPTTIITVAYAGSRGEHIWYGQSRDVAPIQDLSYGSQLTTQVANPYAGQITGSLGAATVSFAQRLLPFPQYTSVTWNRAPVGDTYYNAFTAELRRRDRHGLHLQLSYTLSKNVGDVPERYQGRGSTVIDPLDLRLTRGLAEYDRPQWFVGNYIYDLPFGPGHSFLGHGIPSAIVGKWSISGITTYGAGLPVVITGPNSTSLPGITAVANRLHNPHLASGQNPEHWFDTTAYGAAAAYTTGTGNRIEPDLRGPAYGQWDFAVHRRQEFKEGVVLELRLEALNVFNNRQLSPPIGSITSGTFGQITGSGQARQGQAGARITF